MYKGLNNINKEKVISIAQKVSILALFFSVIGMIIYSLIFMTPFYEIYKLTSPFLFTNMSQFGIDAEYRALYEGITEGAILPCSYNPFSGKVNGINLQYFTEYTRENGLQIYNHWLFNVGIIALVISVIPFIVFSQKRKRYYVANYIANGASAGFNLYMGLSLIINGAAWKELVRQQDFRIISAYQSYINEDAEIVNYYAFDKVKWVFDLGNVVGIILIVISVFAVCVSIIKFLNQRKMAKINFKEVKINE